MNERKGEALGGRGGRKAEMMGVMKGACGEEMIRDQCEGEEWSGGRGGEKECERRRDERKTADAAGVTSSYQ